MPKCLAQEFDRMTALGVSQSRHPTQLNLRRLPPHEESQGKSHTITAYKWLGKVLYSATVHM